MPLLKVESNSLDNSILSIISIGNFNLPDSVFNIRLIKISQQIEANADEKYTPRLVGKIVRRLGFKVDRMKKGKYIQIKS